MTCQKCFFLFKKSYLMKTILERDNPKRGAASVAIFGSEHLEILGIATHRIVIQVAYFLFF